MGDRNNPIKFGPEWLRNLSRERNGASNAGNQNNQYGFGNMANPGSAAAGAGATAGATPSSSNTSGTTPSTPSTSTATSNPAGATGNTPQSKLLLAKLRYGREEMLAMYDRSSEAPQELKHNEFLYQPRGKPPFALHNTFEDDTSGNMRSGNQSGNSSHNERFGTPRNMGRGSMAGESRGRPRMPFTRQSSGGRGTWLSGGPRSAGREGFGGEDESPQRPWGSSNGANSNRNSNEQPEWTPNSKMFRNKRQGQATNWRQSRDDNEEWRLDTARSRSQHDKWASNNERDWGDKPTSDKPQDKWNQNRRPWAGDSQNDDLPEWAVDNAEGCAGTFDSSGAFHGFSNDDSNLPRPQDNAYSLTRSHTHGNIPRNRPMEEGSEEWWASEKAKKLSPKKFDASDIQFNKKPMTPGQSEASSSMSNTKTPTGNEDAPQPETPEQLDASSSDVPQPGGNAQEEDMYQKRMPQINFTESKTFDSLMRSDINLEDANDERGNFQSVMITPNNTLRQQHQNMVPATSDNSAGRQNRKPPMMNMMSPSDYDNRNPHSTPEDKIVEEIFDMTLEDKDIGIISKNPAVGSLMNPPIPAMPSGMMPMNTMPQMGNPPMQMPLSNPMHPNQGMPMNKPIIPPPNMQSPGMPTPGIQQVGLTNSALNASLGLPIGSPGPNMGMQMQGMPPPMISNSGMSNPGMGGLSAGMAAAMQPNGPGMGGFPTGGGLSGMATGNSLFLNQNANSGPMPNHPGPNNLFGMHGLQHSASQSFGGSMFNMMPPPPSQPQHPPQNLGEQWYYEDPKKIIQGPFSSKEMYNWYRAGFFTPSLMVRRACDAHMRPLGSYGLVVPFEQVDMIPSFPMSNSFKPRSQGPHDMMNSQPGLGLESDSLWSQPSPNPDMMWMQQAINARNEARVNNLPMYFWDQQPSAMTSSTLLPEEIAKEMKTEDQILAQMRASQNINTQPNIPFMNDQPETTLTAKKAFPATENMAPNLEELQKLIQNDIITKPTPVETTMLNEPPVQIKTDKPAKVEQPTTETTTKAQQNQNKPPAETKPVKQAKNEPEKAKPKENNAKNKGKKAKEEKKEETEVKKEEEIVKAEKRSQESSPTKGKKEEKLNKKELEKEKKEWLKDGFTIVKGSEKTNNKDKKKADEAKAAEDVERKKKEDEKLAAEEEKKKKQAETVKKQQEQQQQRQASESVIKKAPWSAVANQSLYATTKEGLTLGEIQRLEREKKLEQMKEQHQMMQIIAQQQAAQLAREQEMQAGLGWAKKKGSSLNIPGQSLAEIQAEARRQAAAAAMAAGQAQALEEAHAATQAQTPINHAPWGNAHNGGSTSLASGLKGGGFWDTQPNTQSKPVEKAQESPKMDQLKAKKKPTVVITPKKESSPAAEFETWCTSVLTSWSSKIDVPTFIGFLKDIESPYEVKDYVKCYLGESKDSNDFARQFLERRSKLLRVGMVTPSDDLCSPAIAVNPRTISGSDYQEVKGKGKKAKKNKMLKVDARILGFSVTAAEDRINVGDIDTV